jgi:Icc-related predicted phosphoesterase
MDAGPERSVMTTVRVAAIADLHCTKTSQGIFQPLFASIRESAADLLLIAGDLTDYGLPEEAHVLARDLGALRIPIVAVLGNHDVESGRETDVTHVLAESGVTVLDGDAREVAGVGIAGVKGFGGGFGNRALAPWGETAVKQFAREALEEALKLENALARLRTTRIIALMHYSPVQQTVDGEPLEIYPFLGSSRLEEPINRYPVSFVLHGHAHRGRIEGITARGVPVYNVSMPLLTRTFPDQPAFRIFEVASPAVAEGAGVARAGEGS